MLKKNLRKLMITSFIILIPVIVGLILWDKLPDSIPMHWDMKGNVDRYGSKTTAVFFMPLLLAAIHWICAIGTSIDPKNKNISEKTFTLVLWIIPVLSLVCNSMVYATALGHTVYVEVITPLLLGVVFIVIGNYLPKCKQNYTVGIKIPWTLDDEENWNKTHRLAGFLWVIGGVVILATAFLGSTELVFCIIVPIVIIPCVYSYILYKKKN